MTVEVDPSAAFSGFAHPDRLVSTDWLRADLGDPDLGDPDLGDPGLVVVESDEDVLLYENGHISGAVKIDWHTDLNDPVERDYIDGARFAALLGSKGIGRDSTVIIYGDKNNRWAAYVLWVFSLFGHEDVRLFDGGRAKWEAEGGGYVTQPSKPAATGYPLIERDDSRIRAFRDDVLAHWGNPHIDAQDSEEYTGERTTAPAYPEEGALRAGHIPSARNAPWGSAVAEDGTFRPAGELDAIYRAGAGLVDEDDVIVYCRVGERSAHTWFVLTHLLGFEGVRNYDGSWTEWGSAVRVPIVRGSDPGPVPTRSRP